jgi:hypothetical protein
MKTIYKYMVTFGDKTEFSAPSDFKALSLQMQNGVPCIWAIVDTQAEMKTYTVYCLNTGETMLLGMILNSQYLGTVVLPREGLVKHFYIKS